MPRSVTTEPTRTRSRQLPADVWLVTLDGVAPDETGLLAAGAGRTLRLQTEPGGVPPLSFRSGDVAVVFDGVIYDREALCSKLGEDPEAVAQDAQLALEAYLAWGDDMPARIKGIFTLVVFDGRRGKVMAARDRVGIHPLFYSEESGSLRMAATVEAFSTLSAQPPQVDPGVLAGVLNRHHPGLEQTFHVGVKRVPPGSLLIAEGGTVRVERYWRPPPVGAGADWVEERELGQFGELLDKAVGRAMDGGRAGIFLSGGLDSVSVAAAALERAHSLGLPEPRALSLLFPGEVNEEETQRAVAEQLGMPMTSMGLEEIVGQQGLVRAALDFAAVSAAPPQNVWLPAYNELALAGKQEGCTSILTGGGGDEWLTVTPLLAADLLARFDMPGLLRFAAALQRSLRLPVVPLWRNIVWTNGAKPLLMAHYRDLQSGISTRAQERRLERNLVARLERIPDWLAPDSQLRSRLESEIASRMRSRAGRSRRPGPGGFYFSQMENSLRHPLFAIDVEEIFESGRRWGMRQHDIYWDADLIEFLYRVPPHLLNSGGRSKGLVRQDLARRFPGLGFDRQKKLLSRNYFAETLFDQSIDAWHSLGGAPALAELGVVEPRGLDAFVSRVSESRDRRHIDDLWRVLSLESWVRPRV